MLNSYHKMKIEHMVDFDIWNKVTIFCLVCNINNILPLVIQLLESQLMCCLGLLVSVTIFLYSNFYNFSIFTNNVGIPFRKYFLEKIVRKKNLQFWTISFPYKKCVTEERTFLRKIQNRINRRIGKKIVLLYGIWIWNLEVVVFPSKFEILNLEVVVFPSKFNILNLEVVVFPSNFEFWTWR